MTPKQARTFAKTRFAEGLTHAQIAKELADQGFKTQKGTSPKPSTISVWLSKPTKKPSQTTTPHQTSPEALLVAVKNLLQLEALPPDQRITLAILAIGGRG